jgi:hypothetical protein
VACSCFKFQPAPLPCYASEERLDDSFLRFNDVNNVTGGMRPLATSPCTGPCLNLKAKTTGTKCRPLACTRPGWQRLGYPCSPDPFHPNVLLDCFCNQVCVPQGGVP